MGSKIASVALGEGSKASLGDSSGSSEPVGVSSSLGLGERSGVEVSG